MDASADYGVSVKPRAFLGHCGALWSAMDGGRMLQELTGMDAISFPSIFFLLLLLLLYTLDIKGVGCKITVFGKYAQSNISRSCRYDFSCLGFGILWL
jgi:hypothetical protein